MKVSEAFIAGVENGLKPLNAAALKYVDQVIGSSLILPRKKIFEKVYPALAEAYGVVHFCTRVII